MLPRTRGRPLVLLRKRPCAPDVDGGADAMPFRTGERRLAFAARSSALRDPSPLVHIDLPEGTHFLDDAYRTQTLFDRYLEPRVTGAVTAGVPAPPPLCVMAFGQTGSGKTHTLTGGHGEERGVLTLAVARLLETVSVASVRLSAVEIDGQRCVDLLRRGRPPHAVRWHEAQGRVFARPALERRTCNRVADAERLLAEVAARRSSGETLLNTASSRTHVLYLVFAEPRSGNGNRFVAPARRATLLFADLAGMEKPRFHAANADVRTSIRINRALFALKECIRSVRERRAHVPFRQSALTMALRDYLDDVQLCCIATLHPAPACASDALDTVRYAHMLAAWPVRCTPAPRAPLHVPPPPPRREPRFVPRRPPSPRPSHTRSPPVARRHRTTRPSPPLPDPSPNPASTPAPRVPPPDPASTPAPRVTPPDPASTPAPVPAHKKDSASSLPPLPSHETVVEKYRAYVMTFYRLLRKDARRHSRLRKRQRAAREADAGASPALSLTLVRDNIRLIDEKANLLRHERRLQEALLLGIARGAPFRERSDSPRRERTEEDGGIAPTVARRSPIK